MKWRKIGAIFSINNFNSWMKTHAQVPTVLCDGEILRVYFSARDMLGESRVGYLELDAKDPQKVLHIQNNPVLDLGQDGCFDEHGVMPSCVLPDPTDPLGLILYYSGWSRRLKVPYSNLTGAALSNDGISFRRLGEGPIISTRIDEPYSATSPFVIAGSSKHTMYYSSGNSWQSINGKLEHTYNLRKASSIDGLSWNQSGEVCLDQSHPEEAITRPTIIDLDGTYHMWFCYRGSREFRGGVDSYRIGYAKSSDQELWERDDSKSGITVSQSGWDNEMIAYPYVVSTQHGVYMFYNGNGFGRSGFGYAVLE